VGVILVAGLWPFCAPKNKVEWLNGENGLRFGHHGIVASVNPFIAAPGDGACSLEILLEPERANASGTVLSFDSFPDPKFAFGLRQLGNRIAIQRGSRDAKGALIRPWMTADRIFQQGKRSLLTITGSGKQTTIYLNGVRSRSSSEFGLVAADLTGRLVVGNSTGNDSWAGRINGLAVYDLELTSSQVAAHFVSWTHQNLPEVAADPAPRALYLFDEGKGNVIHDRVDSRHDLMIARRYFVVHPTFLRPVWDEFRTRWDGGMTWSYWSDVLVNIAGFIPMGFLLMAFFSLARPVSRPRVLVVFLGLSVSLLIEIWQHFLPTRDSSTIDLITNTFGTALGVALCRPTLVSKFLHRRL
jgi:hypothetical protein